MSIGFIHSNAGALFGHRDVVGFGNGDFRVCLIDMDLSNRIIRENHYSRKIMNNSYLHLGVFAGRTAQPGGVLQFGYALNPSSGANIVPGTPNDGYMELNRMWLHDDLPRNSESMALACAIKLIRRLYPLVKWIQSFADERCGRYGVVYQAANFIYYGEHTTEFCEIDGEYFHRIAWTSPSKGGDITVARYEAGKDRAVWHSLRQFRYIYWLDRRLTGACTLARQPYPKHGATGLAPKADA